MVPYRAFSQLLEQVSVFVLNIGKFLPVHPRMPLACRSGHFGIAYSGHRNSEHKLGDLEGMAE